MKRLHITFTTILLVFGCFAFSPAAKAAQPVVGLWQVEYTGACEPPVLPPDFLFCPTRSKLSPILDYTSNSLVKDEVRFKWKYLLSQDARSFRRH